MKITIDVDCTPQEARIMLGLPDVKPMQESMMAEMEERMRKAMQSMDAEALMKTWMCAMPSVPGGIPGEIPGGIPGGIPDGVQGFEKMQKAFWSQMAAGMSAPKSSGSKSSG